MADLVTLPELNDVLNLDGDTSHDVELGLYIAAVTAHVASQYGDLPSGTYTELAHAFLDEDGRVRLLLTHQPVSTVTSIRDGSGTTYTTGFTITANGYLEHANLTTGRWTVVYVSGFAAVPADLKLAALEDIRGLYQPGQIGPPGAFGAFGIDSTEVGPAYRPVRLWPRVDAWIELRRLPGIA